MVDDLLHLQEIVEIAYAGQDAGYGAGRYVQFAEEACELVQVRQSGVGH